MSNLGPFVWSIADQLRGVYKPHQYGSIVLPFTILRRLDVVGHDVVDTFVDAGGRRVGVSHRLIATSSAVSTSEPAFVLEASNHDHRRGHEHDVQHQCENTLKEECTDDSRPP